jgi:hypothetical protein
VRDGHRAHALHRRAKRADGGRLLLRSVVRHRHVAATACARRSDAAEHGMHQRCMTARGRQAASKESCAKQRRRARAHENESLGTETHRRRAPPLRGRCPWSRRCPPSPGRRAAARRWPAPPGERDSTNAISAQAVARRARGVAAARLHDADRHAVLHAAARVGELDLGVYLRSHSAVSGTNASVGLPCMRARAESPRSQWRATGWRCARAECCRRRPARPRRRLRNECARERQLATSAVLATAQHATSNGARTWQ